MLISEETEQNLKNLLKKYDPIQTALIFSGLLLNPKYHQHQYRLEIAIKSCLAYGNGKKLPNRKIIKDIYDEMKSYEISSQEDPIEDIFISTLWFEKKDYKVLLGLWEGGLSSTQLFLEVLESIPNNTKTLILKKKIVSILKISDYVIESKNLLINKIGWDGSIKNILESDLKKVGSSRKQNKVLNFNDYDLPTVDINQCRMLLEEEIGASILEFNPFFVADNDIFILLPSAITTSIRKHILDFMINHDFLNMFSKNIDLAISKQIHNTLVFGKLPSLTFHFNNVKEINDFSFAEAYFEFDSGYFFHFIIVSDKMKNPNNTWFAGYLDRNEDQVSKYIDSRIKSVKQEVLTKDTNNKGCTILVPFGFGRMYSLSCDLPIDEKWLVTGISYHDLITISNDSGISVKRSAELVSF